MFVVLYLLYLLFFQRESRIDTYYTYLCVSKKIVISYLKLTTCIELLEEFYQQTYTHL
nr:MAG TPA_asm: hypothetical protein [Bacteriophage sp.]DAP05611.1 MAG TPA: hypothetical protein [Caudoviricetes sp.]